MSYVQLSSMFVNGRGYLLIQDVYTHMQATINLYVSLSNIKVEEHGPSTTIIIHISIYAGGELTCST